jgi:hypothetical protein
MDIDQQIAALIQDAPQDGRTPALVRGIAPALRLIAQRLRHLQYYILQSSQDGRWLSTTLSLRAQPAREKTVIYAFADRKDALAQANPLERYPPIAVPQPVIPLLFQMVTLNTIESMIFFEAPGDPDDGTEVFRQEVEDLIQTHLQGIMGSLGRDIPPDIA